MAFFDRMLDVMKLGEDEDDYYDDDEMYDDDDYDWDDLAYWDRQPEFEW